jgi:hypothetical protein
MSQPITEVVASLVGLRCEAIENPIGSIISIDFGPLSLRPDDPPTARPHGYRHLTVLSPWRVQTDDDVIVDSNVDGGTNGLIRPLLRDLVGQRVVAAATSPPAWDLRISLSSSVHLLVFGDATDDRDDAWFILGTDGIQVAGQPVLRALPNTARSA